jgi:hypothetical protein
MCILDHTISRHQKGKHTGVDHRNVGAEVLLTSLVLAGVMNLVSGSVASFPSPSLDTASSSDSLSSVQHVCLMNSRFLGPHEGGDVT